MPYERRLHGQTVAHCAAEEEAVAAARRLLATGPDSGPEVIDLATCEPATPAATWHEREELADKIGY